MSHELSPQEYMRLEAFADHISAAVPGKATWIRYSVAEFILHNPQAHIDALVEAGVLESCNVWKTELSPHAVGNTVSPGYRVVQPHVHVHEWRVEYANHAHTTDNAFIFCLGCKEQRAVPNRLPIEVPDA